MNLKEKILECVELKNESALNQWLGQSLSVHRMLNNQPLEHPATELKIHKFLLGIDPVVNEVPKKNRLEVIAKLITLILSEFRVELSDSEAILFYSFKDLGRFRVKDSKHIEEGKSKGLFVGDYEEVVDDYKSFLIELKNVGLIQIRKGSITLCDRVMLK